MFRLEVLPDSSAVLLVAWLSAFVLSVVSIVFALARFIASLVVK